MEISFNFNYFIYFRNFSNIYLDLEKLNIKNSIAEIYSFMYRKIMEIKYVEIFFNWLT
jgi:hypothetical protein